MIGQSIDGGVRSIQPYVVLYGFSNGRLRAAKPKHSVTDFTGGDALTANVCSSKILLRGSPLEELASLECLLWSLEDVIRMRVAGRL